MSEKKEYIERGALLKAFGCENAVKYGNKNAEQQHKSYSSMMLYEIADEIYDAPAADVEPVVRGEWKEFDADMNAYSCSVCNEPQMFIEGNPEQNEYSFCPYCGAHMERSGSDE